MVNQLFQESICQTIRWDANLSSSVHTSKFRIPQLLYLPLLRKLPGVWVFFPFWNGAARRFSLTPVFSLPRSPLAPVRGTISPPHQHHLPWLTGGRHE